MIHNQSSFDGSASWSLPSAEGAHWSDPPFAETELGGRGSLRGEFGAFDLHHRNDKVLSPTVEALVDRHIVQRRLFENGALECEAEAAGLAGSWVKDLWRDAQGGRCLIALAEPLAPLPTIFCQLGHFGSPQDLERAFDVMMQSRHHLANSGISAHLGMASSRYFQITYHGETCNYQFFLPREGGGIIKHQLIPDRTRKKLAGSPHHLLKMPESSIHRLLTYLENNRTPEGDRFAKDIAHSREGAEGPADSISYWGLVSNYNQLFVSSRFFCDFTTANTDQLDGMLTFGVIDWGVFMERAARCGLIEQGRSFARRACMDEEGNFSHYEMLYAYEGSLVTNDRGVVFDAYELQHTSQESWHANGELLLLPNKELRYWGFSFDAVIRFDDGIPFEALDRVAGIVGSGEMGQTPRGLPLASYSRAGSVHHLSYAELEPIHPATEFYSGMSGANGQEGFGG